MSSEDFYASSAYKNLICPDGSQKGGVISTRPPAGPIHKFRCWKNYRSPDAAAAQLAQEAYYEEIEEAREAAAEESRRWNEANPGKQKCIQYGPITGPNGEQASGGVCANIVNGASSSSSPSSSPSVGQEQPAGTVGEGDISSPSSSSSVSQTTSSSVSAPLETAPPVPNQTSRIKRKRLPIHLDSRGSGRLVWLPGPI